ncbi:hypothetical protein [Salinisphaera sp. Q1T1-3]|uniref:hypothetical protein n=1 Tax=Salinisphaera sp. Q1T1-3 TaxID=2321229 RepID=UPI000E7115E0|nr:hypothetical protein [Salinisphaera sp. Q1T1-3]RJS92387.1 hypothetical protein D3260_12150 [Salinisphaera sp. Q1T1-3]
MPQAIKPSRLGAVVLGLSALAGLIIALYAYLAPLTGVTGTLGALLVIGVSALLIVMALVLMALSAGGGRIAWRVLILIALAGNAFAAALLHEWWLCIAMGVGLIGLIIDMCSPARAQGV